MTGTLSLLKTLVARQMAVENILIEHNLTDKEKLQQLTEHYRHREDIEKLFADIKDEFGDITRWQFLNYLDSARHKEDTK